MQLISAWAHAFQLPLSGSHTTFCGICTSVTRLSTPSLGITLRGLLFDVVRELVLTGNSFLRPIGRGEQLRLVRIPITFIQPRLDVVVEGEEVRVVNYYITVRVGTHYETRKIPANEVIHLAWNVLDPSAPWGYGLGDPERGS